MVRQCELLGLSRSGWYYQPKPALEELSLRSCIDEVYTDHPFYGSRKLAVVVGERLGIAVNRKGVQKAMRAMGIAGITPGRNTSKSAKGHRIYPYLLRNHRITRANEVWSTDITYVRMVGGFAYLVAVIDWYSRYVLSWSLSNSMEVSFCVEALEAALRLGQPEIFNTDQGSQFTSDQFTSILIGREIKVSMDGRGRALDNVFVERLWRSVKYENIYLMGYESLEEARAGLARYFTFYNNERPHMSLGYARPNEVYQTCLH